MNSNVLLIVIATTLLIVLGVIGVAIYSCAS